MCPPPPRRFRVEIRGDLAVAAYYLIAHWPDPRTVPELHTSGGPLAISFDGTPKIISDLKGLLLRVVREHGGLLSSSARAFLRLVETWEATQPSADSRGESSAAG
jgi:hypothetical protein